LVEGNGRLSTRWQQWLANLFELVRGLTQIDLAARTVSASVTLQPTDTAVFVDASAGSVVITLGDPALFTGLYVIKKIDSSLYPVVVDGPGPELPETLAGQFDVMRLSCDGTNFYLV
jgi:hypothetical protein